MGIEIPRYLAIALDKMGINSVDEFAAIDETDIFIIYNEVNLKVKEMCRDPIHNQTVPADIRVLAETENFSIPDDHKGLIRLARLACIEAKNSAS